jgi:hypothetical protein
MCMCMCAPFSTAFFFVRSADRRVAGLERFGDSWVKADAESRSVVSNLSLREVKRWTATMSSREDENQVNLKR